MKKLFLFLIGGVFFPDSAHSQDRDYYFARNQDGQIVIAMGKNSKNPQPLEMLKGMCVAGLGHPVLVRYDAKTRHCLPIGNIDPSIIRMGPDNVMASAEIVSILETHEKQNPSLSVNICRDFFSQYENSYLYQYTMGKPHLIKNAATYCKSILPTRTLEEASKDFFNFAYTLKNPTHQNLTNGSIFTHGRGNVLKISCFLNKQCSDIQKKGEPYIYIDKDSLGKMLSPDNMRQNMRTDVFFQNLIKSKQSIAVDYCQSFERLPLSYRENDPILKKCIKNDPQYKPIVQSLTNNVPHDPLMNPEKNADQTTYAVSDALNSNLAPQAVITQDVSGNDPRLQLTTQPISAPNVTKTDDPFLMILGGTMVAGAIIYGGKKLYDYWQFYKKNPDTDKKSVLKSGDTGKKTGGANKISVKKFAVEIKKPSNTLDNQSKGGGGENKGKINRQTQKSTPIKNKKIVISVNDSSKKAVDGSKISLKIDIESSKKHKKPPAPNKKRSSAAA